MKITGTIFFTASIITGLIVIRKANENLDYLIGEFIIIQGVLIGIVFFFLAKVRLNSDEQIKLLEDIRNQIYQKEDIKI